MQTATTSSTKESLVNKLGFEAKDHHHEVLREKSADVVRDFRNFVADVEDLLKATAQSGGEDLAKAKEKLNERIAQAKTSLAAASESLADRASKTAASANEYVHEKPWPVIGAGAALGFVAGYLLTRHD